MLYTIDVQAIVFHLELIKVPKLNFFETKFVFWNIFSETNVLD